MKNFLCFLIFILAMFNGYTSDKLSKSKEFADIVLHYISKGNSYGYYRPLQTIVDENNANIIYQRYVESLNSSFVTIKIIWHEKSDPLISYYDEYFRIRWDNGKIAEFSRKNSSTYYTCFYDQITGKLRKIVDQDRTNPKLTHYKEMEYDNDNVSKLTAYHYDKKEKFITASTTFEYYNDSIVKNISSYSYGPKKKIKDMIIRPTKYTFRWNEKNEYIVSVNDNPTKEALYDNDGLLIREKGFAHNERYYRKHVYIDGKKFSTTQENHDKTGKFLQKTITVQFSLENQDESVPIYERMQGTYKFDEAGELIWEERNTKYRKKIGNQWTEWIQMTY